VSCDLHFVDFGRRPTCYLWEDEPSDYNGDCTRTREASTQKRHQPFSSYDSIFLDKKMHLQETSLNSPFIGRGASSPVDHKGRAKAEHKAYEIRYSEGPGGSPRAQALLGNLGRVSVADC
jgi:hypothetical protein